MHINHLKLYFLAGGLGFTIATLLTIVNLLIVDANEVLPLAGNDFMQMAIFVIGFVAIATTYLIIRDLIKWFQ